VDIRVEVRFWVDVGFREQGAFRAEVAFWAVVVFSVQVLFRTEVGFWVDKLPVLVDVHRFFCISSTIADSLLCHYGMEASRLYDV
jgi:hypothetical protein